MTFDLVFDDDIAKLREVSQRDPIEIDNVMQALPFVSSRGQRVLRGGTGEEEARANLQARLTVLAKLLFWSFAVLLGSMVGLYAAFPEVEPRNNGTINALGTITLTMLAMVWRGPLIRRQLSLKSLRGIDALLAIGPAIVLATSSVLAHDLRSSAYYCLIYTCLTVLLRAVLVPSTPRHTTVLGVFTCLPMIVGMIVLSYVADQDLPAPGYVGGGVLICMTSILLAATSSRVVYGLRLKIKAAMQLGQYTLDRKIGEGGNGAVYMAHHSLLRRPTAVKLIRPDLAGPQTLERFEREVQLASQLTHPNTVAVYDYGRSPDGVLYFAMEYLDGLDLQQLVTRFGPQPADRVVRILIQICGSLEEAHSRGMIHRDVKPANVILCQRGGLPDFVKVVDFGLAKEIGSSPGNERQPILGTPAYLAPESVTDPGIVGPKADVYGVGCIGYFLLSGKAVFDGRNALDVCLRHVTSIPSRPSSVTRVALSRDFEDLIMRLLSKDPNQRPTASELAKELHALPVGDTWRDEDAVRWWSEFSSRRPQEAICDDPTLTICIDIGAGSDKREGAR